MSSFNKQVEAQFDECPYPNVPYNQQLAEDDIDLKFLLANNITTAYYIRDRKVVNPADFTVLNAGCGSAWEFLKIAMSNPASRFVGVDISKASIELAIERFQFHQIPNAEFHVQSVEALSSLQEQFDFIVCSDVLYLLDDPLAGLASLKQALKPTGILRANLHSLCQRQLILNAQKAIKLCGLMDEPAQQAVPLLREVMDSLNPDSYVKHHWDSHMGPIETILSNYLIRNDKGFTVPEMFSMLEQTGLEFISMANWYEWELSHTLKKPLLFAESYIQKMSFPERLHFIELLYPNLTRLIDFWCGHPQYKTRRTYTEKDWWYGNVYIHPLLYQISDGHSIVDEALRNHTPIHIWRWPTVEGGVKVDAFNARWLASVFEQPAPVQSLVAKAQEVLQMETDMAFMQVMTILQRLEQNLVVLLESPFA